MEEIDKLMTEEDIERDLKEMVPENILSEDVKEHASKLVKYGYVQVVKYLNEVNPNLGLKRAKIYYDLYLKKDENDKENKQDC